MPTTNNISPHVWLFFILLNSSFIIPVSLFPTIAVAQENTTACRDLLRDALRNHHALPDSGRALRRLMQVRTVRRAAGKLDTVVSAVETVDWNGGQLLRSDSMEIWSDEKTMVVVEERTTRLRIMDLSDKRKILAAQQRFNAGFADSLAGYAGSIRCEEIQGKNGPVTRIGFVVDSTMRRFFNTESMTVEIDRKGEIIRMAMTHPSGSAVVSTEYVVREVNRSWRGVEVGGPVLRHFLDESGKLLPAYAGYGVTSR